jgi:hypothetical protein
VNLLAALDDPLLFQPHFSGASWNPWRTFLKSLFGLPMSDSELDIFRLRTERQTQPTSPFQ